MPVTSTPDVACNVKIILGDVNGVDRDISGMANKYEPSFTRDIGEFVVFGDVNKWRTECKQDSSIALTIVSSRDVNGAWYLLKQWWTQRGYRHVRAYFPEDAVGNDIFDGYYLLSDLKATFDAGEAGPVMVDVTLLPNGGTNISTAVT